MFGGTNLEVDELIRNQKHVSKSFIDKSFGIVGDLNFKDTLEIQGTVTGNINSDFDSISFLIVGKNAKIIGDIRSSHVVIFGRVVGNICAPHVEIEESAKITGNVCYKTIEVHYGAKINGAMSIETISRLVPKPVKPPAITNPNEVNENKKLNLHQSSNDIHNNQIRLTV